MKYFKPTKAGAETNCYVAGMCSAKKPVGLDGRLAEKAARNPEFTEVIKKKATKKVI
jgi:hypothetical protein